MAALLRSDCTLAHKIFERVSLVEQCIYARSSPESLGPGSSRGGMVEAYSFDECRVGYSSGGETVVDVNTDRPEWDRTVAHTRYTG